jgi:EmrB/QacA subfamily drug resistance transporter
MSHTEIRAGSSAARSILSRSGATSQTRSTGLIVLVLLCVAEFMIAVDFSIVNVALPTIRAALGFGQDGLQWVISAYALTFGGFLLLGGRASDLYGRRRLLVGGLMAFAAFSLLAGVSGSSVMLVLMRGAQGLAAAVIAPTALSLLTTNFAEGPERERALGAWGAVLGAGFVTGVVAGGVLTQLLSWRWVFFVNVPVALGTAALVPLVVSEPAQARHRARLDLPGATLVTAAIIALVYALSRANVVGWGSGETLGLIAASVLLAGAFVFSQGRAREPLIPLGIFRLRGVSISNLANVAIIGTFVGYVFVATLFLQGIVGYSALQTGLVFVPAGVAGFTAGLAAPKIAGRTGPRVTLVGAILLQAAGIAALIALPRHGTAPVVIACALAINFADVVAIVMINVAATTGLPDSQQGLAGGILNTSQQLGAALGVAVFAAIATARTQSLTAAGAHPTTNALVSGYRYSLATAAVICLVTAALAWVGLRESTRVASTGGHAASE